MNEDWPRVKDLPKGEQEAFVKWLEGQSRPLIEGIPEDEQDGYFPWDYTRWKRQVIGILNSKKNLFD